MSDDPKKKPKDIFNDFLKSAKDTVDENRRIEQMNKERADKEKTLRTELKDKAAEMKQAMRDKYDEHIQPILAALESLPAKGGQFTVNVAFDDGDIETPVAAMDAKKYRGPQLTIQLSYSGKLPAAQNGERPAIDIVITPNQYSPEKEDIRVTRYDRYEVQWADQGGTGPLAPSQNYAYSYESLRQTLGRWLAEVAPDRLQELSNAAANPPPSGPVTKKPADKYKGGSLKK